MQSGSSFAEVAVKPQQPSHKMNCINPLQIPYRGLMVVFRMTFPDGCQSKHHHPVSSSHGAYLHLVAYKNKVYSTSILPWAEMSNQNELRLENFEWMHQKNVEIIKFQHICLLLGVHVSVIFEWLYSVKKSCNYVSHVMFQKCYPHNIQFYQLVYVLQVDNCVKFSLWPQLYIL